MRLSHCVLCPTVFLSLACVCTLECVVCVHQLLVELSAAHEATLNWKDIQLLGTDFLIPSGHFLSHCVWLLRNGSFRGVTF